MLPDDILCNQDNFTFYVVQIIDIDRISISQVQITFYVTKFTFNAAMMIFYVGEMIFHVTLYVVKMPFYDFLCS